MNKTVFHRLKANDDYRHVIAAGFLVVLGFVFLLGISSFSRNVLVFIGFCGLAVFAYRFVKTTKPITIATNSICLGKGVVGFKSIWLKAWEIRKIELIYEKKIEDQPVARLKSGVVQTYSNYYLIYLKQGELLKFDNSYDDNLKVHIRGWCEVNQVEVNLEIEKLTDVSTEDLFE
ncbi:hypothetical protein BC643_3215 [Mangrovibacterium diazotrophicum]|uniref:PH (Pleckstrin Homology) domain-containing protein n=2 Tax=Mangrovibacterium diazotrophicum TaxID=1261403 RepID=A0A419WBK5_9BACT|nr:hypothetical protein BC643_3215 [Mangrovibacterium diazotrophicum]